MRIYFIKDWDDNGFLHKAGQSPTMWTDTALRALAEKVAVPYEEKDFVKVQQNEPQAEEKAEPKSRRKNKEAEGEAEEIKTNEQI